MNVKAKMNILYAGQIFRAGEIFDMDECTAAISLKYGKIEKLEGGTEPELDEGDAVEGLPPLKKKK